MASGQFPPNQPNPFGANPHAPQQQPAKSNNTAIILVILGVVFAGMLVCGGILVALLLPAVGAARNAAQRMQRANQAKQVALALHNYHSTHKQLPATISAKSSGEEVFGWRFALAPYVNGQSQWNSFDQEQSWDSPANQGVTNNAPPEFQAMEGPPGQTHIFAIVSDQGIFVTTPNQGIKFRDIVDGLANTVMAIELPDRSVTWTSTENLTPDQAYNAIQQLQGVDVAHLIMGDGAVMPVSSDLDRTMFDAMVTRDGKEDLFLPSGN